MFGFTLQGLLSGCTTGALWEEGTFARYHEPTEPPEMRLYFSPQRKDVLVEYLDEREDEKSTQWRAFWLYHNVERVRARSRPHFEPLATGKDLRVIPVYATPEAAAPARERPGMYAVLTGNKHEFILLSGDRELGTFELPVYRDASGRVKQVLLTPPALVADTAIIAGVLFVACLPALMQALAQSVH